MTAPCDPDEVPRECRRAAGDAWTFKARFDSRDLAKAANHRLDAYQCWYCGFWHLGHGTEARQFSITFRWKREQKEGAA